MAVICAHDYDHRRGAPSNAPARWQSPAVAMCGRACIAAHCMPNRLPHITICPSAAHTDHGAIHVSAAHAGQYNVHASFAYACRSAGPHAPYTFITLIPMNPLHMLIATMYRHAGTLSAHVSPLSRPALRSSSLSGCMGACIPAQRCFAHPHRLARICAHTAPPHCAEYPQRHL